MKICPVCKADYDEEFFFCENDGNKLEQKSDNSSELNLLHLLNQITVYIQ